VAKNQFPEVYKRVMKTKKSEWIRFEEESLYATVRFINTPFAQVFHKELADITFVGRMGHPTPGSLQSTKVR
jgi:hypothetical protein